MRKGTLLIVAALALAAAGGGCARDDGGEGASREISFGTEASRAVIEDSNFPDDASFNVWGWYGDDATTGATPTQVFDAAKVTNNSGTWGCNVTRYWIPGKSYDFYALYPAGMGQSGSKGEIIVVEEVKASMGEEAVDLMTASATGETYSEGRGPVKLPFNHELAQAKVTIQAEQGVTATVQEVRLYGIYTSASFSGGIGENGADESWSYQGGLSGESDNLFLFTSETTVNGGQQVAVLDDMMIPQELTTAALLYVKIEREGENVEARLNLRDHTTSWEAGHSYNYTVNVSSEYITFSGFTADGWAESHSGGDINIGD